ncbi:MAG: flagellar alpha dynein [Microcoleus sp.]
MKAANRQLAEWDKELNQLHERNGDLGLKVQMLEEELKRMTSDRGENRNSVPTVAEFPEPAELLNQLKARRKKSKADLADIEAILELLSQADSLL